MNKYSIKQKTGVLLINLGTPDKPTYFGVMKFLREFLSDNKVVSLPKLFWYPILYTFVLPFRSHSSAKNYRKIWTEQGSPLLTNSIKQIDSLKEQLNPNDYHVEIAMRYGEPSIKKALAELNKPTINNLIVIPLFPQYSSTTTASCFQHVTKMISKWMYIPKVQFINQFCTDRLYIEAIAKSIINNQDYSPNNHTLFSYHGLPASLLKKGDPYYCFCHKTTRLVAEYLAMNEADYTMSFQSRFGLNKWLTPYTLDKVMELAKSGNKVINLIAPSFVSDCLETLYELEIELIDIFRAHGGEKIIFIRSLNNSLNFTNMLTEIINANNR